MRFVNLLEHPVYVSRSGGQEAGLVQDGSLILFPSAIGERGERKIMIGKANIDDDSFNICDGILMGIKKQKIINIPDPAPNLFYITTKQIALALGRSDLVYPGSAEGEYISSPDKNGNILCSCLISIENVDGGVGVPTIAS